MAGYDSRAAKRSATLKARIKVAEGPSNPSSRYVRGLLTQLRDAGLVPQGLQIDEHSRNRVRFHHEGRECEIRPYGRWQHEVRITRTEAERDAIERDPWLLTDPAFGKFLRAVLPQQPSA